ncbi:tetratricopeptide repeat protein [Simiduia curdlanivorans]|uniref:Tetratricopeptide repeat protein n=1 Tax=Simiduia curdlanivorans TaxID=1492769 RepID=A0ABV8V7U2_9GAMM|nr:tetratricopeptide repeat protein [Simiduia curdlanivorans]MDN3638614.1 tetratricopeptide repeat protein [Simiduia curdlanivorans]
MAKGQGTIKSGTDELIYMAIKYSKARWQEIQLVLDQVLDQPESEQLAYLAAQCGQDHELLEEVAALLRAGQHAPAFLDRPALDLAGDFSQSLPLETSTSLEQSSSPSDYTGALIGPYRLCEEIGRGGMGLVYRAERTQGAFEQQVAIKLLLNDKGRALVIERFQREQQLLASLVHPNIAQLYDGGLTADGLAYFVMEYVAGQPIHTYCDSRKLSVDQRLRLLLQVANALGFAHQHLIVHRDIKPSNILVTADGQVKLLDFGIAKLLGETDLSDLTRTGEQLLTPGFAAPEQLTNSAITVATDVYQLGLVAYELLTGRRAYRNLATSVAKLVRAICEQEPTRPSSVVMLPVADGSDQLTYTPEQISQLRGVELPSLRRKLSGDLDAIIVKMLANKMPQRYASMDMFRADVEAYFERRPLLAQSPSWSYRSTKFVRRHWRALAAVSAFALLLVVYAGTVTYQSGQIRRALSASQIERDKAQQVSDFLVNVFKAADPNVAGLDSITAKQLLDKSQSKILTDLDNLPEIQAHMLTLIGEVYFSQGNYSNSLALLEDSLARLRRMDKPVGVELGNTLTQLAYVYAYTNRYDEAKALFDESLAIHRQLALATGAQPSYEYGEALSGYGLLQYQQRLYPQAKATLHQALAVLARFNAGNNEEHANALNNLALVEHLQGDFESAREHVEKAIAILKVVLGEAHSYYTVHLMNFVIMLTDMEYYGQAEEIAAQALQLQKSILGERHAYVASSLRNIGVLQYRLGRLTEAEAYLRESLALSIDLQGSNRMQIGATYMWLGAVLRDAGDYTAAAEALENMQEIFITTTKSGEIIGRGKSQLALLALAQGDVDRAGHTFSDALEIMSPEQIRTTYAQVGYAQTLIEAGQPTEAETLLRQALQIRLDHFPEQHSLVAEAQVLLGLALSERGASEEALALLNVGMVQLSKHALFQVGYRQRLLARGAAVQQTLTSVN